MTTFLARNSNFSKWDTLGSRTVKLQKNLFEKMLTIFVKNPNFSKMSKKKLYEKMSKRKTF